MIINGIPKELEIRISALPEGECFEEQGRYFIKTNEVKEKTYSSCCNLETGFMTFFHPTRMVTRVAAVINTKEPPCK